MASKKEDTNKNFLNLLLVSITITLSLRNPSFFPDNKLLCNFEISILILKKLFLHKISMLKNKILCKIENVNFSINKIVFFLNTIIY